MKKIFILMAVLMLMPMLIASCSAGGGGGIEEPIDTVYETTAGTENETVEATERTAAETVEGTAEETEPVPPLHSDLYLNGYTVEQIAEYFNEVVLNVEYSDGTGDTSLVQKWLSPMYYRIYGNPTDTDRQVLNECIEQLNAIPAFPGIYPAADGSEENISLSFLGLADFTESFSDVVNGEYSNGAAQFWYYTMTNELHKARIGYRTDIDQEARNSIILEEIVNVLGISDTVLRSDSITYQYSDSNTALSDVDLVILKLLYDPSILCGMSESECLAVIQSLYY